MKIADHDEEFQRIETRMTSLMKKEFNRDISGRSTKSSRLELRKF